MDFIFRILILFLLLFCKDSWSVVLPKMTVGRVGSTSTYKITEPGFYTPSYSAPSGAGIIGLDADLSVSASGYVRTATMSFGDLMQSVGVKQGVSAASLATAAIAFVPKLTALGIALQAGSALYDYYQSANLVPMPNGTGLGQLPPSTLPPLNSYQSSAGTYSTAILSISAAAALIYSQNNCNPNTASWWYCPQTGYLVSETSNTFTFTLTNAGRDTNYVNVIGSKGSTQTCSSGYTYGAASNTCYRDQAIPTAVSNATAQGLLTANNPANKAPIIKNMHDMSPADVPQSDIAPEYDLPVPITTPSVQSQSVTPDGTVQTQTKQTTITQTAPDTLTASDSSTTTTIHPDGTETTVSTNNPVAPEKNSETDCDKYPESIGCSKYGTVPKAEVIPLTTVPMSLTPSSLGAGSCPSPQVVDLLGQPDITLSYQTYCDFSTSISPIVIAFSWLSAGLMVIGGIREA